MHTGEEVFAVDILLKVSKSFLFRQSKKNVVLFKNMFKVNNRNTRTRSKICSKLTINLYFDLYESSLDF